MDKVKILVVEDESIVAKDIQATLIRLGYDVPGVASSAQSAFAKLEEFNPDLVFLDIRLKGDLDGIHIAEHIKKTYDIPVIFLTSYVDKNTLDRAKVTEPYGYLVKPFNENDLHTTIETALYKFKKDKEVRQNEQRFANALQNLDDAILITDNECRVTFLNPRAETITGYGNDSGQGVNVFKILKIENEEYNLINADALNKRVKNGEPLTITECNITLMRDYSVLKGNVVISPIRDEKGVIIGNALLINVTKPGETKAPAPIQPAAEVNPLESQIVQNFFFVKKGSMLVRVSLESVRWIQAMDNYVIVQTNEDQFIVHATMKDLEVRLPQKMFVRVHRSYIVNIERIDGMDESMIVIKDKSIPVGKSYKDAFMNRINLL